jgi:adenine/guanine phosphoribosyltransferase-like PRPP-binding protein
VAPGEAVFIDLPGQVHAQQCAPRRCCTPCMFEYVYLARPDSVMDGISVYQARLNLGETLAKRVISTVPPNEIDVVIPIPESSRPSAMQLAHLLGKPYREGFVKNRYVGRTFIMPGQGVRKKSVRQKLNAIASEFKGRNVLLVDDSIVRGTTSKEIVQMARDAGARKVYLASAAPPVRFPNVYGIDMPTKQRTGGAWPQHRGDPPDHRLRCADLPGRGRHEEGHRHAEPEAGPASTPPALTASTSPATSQPTTSRVSTPAALVLKRARKTARAWRCPTPTTTYEEFPCLPTCTSTPAGGPTRWPCASCSAAFGENSEALYLTSGLCAARCRQRGRALRGNEEEGYTYTRSPTPRHQPGAAPGGDGRQ